MKLLISAVIFEQYLKSGMCQLELVPMADKYNCTGVEFRPYWRSAVDELPEIKDFLAEYGLVCAYACNEALLADSADGVRENLAAMRQSLDFAHRVGAPILRVNVSGGAFDRSFLGEVWWQDAVKEILAYAADREIVLALENPPNPVSGDPVLIRDILMAFDSPNLRATFDTGNWLVAGYDASQALAMLQPYIAYVHLKDIVVKGGEYIHSHLGTGAVDVLGLVSQLEQSGYGGWYVLEFPGGSSPAKRIQSSLKYLKWE